MKTSFNKLISSESPVLIDFYATWCGPCQAFAPLLKEIAKKYRGKIKVVKIDIDKSQELANQLNIRSVPTIMVYNSGEAVWRQAGAPTMAMVDSKLRSLELT